MQWWWLEWTSCRGCLQKRDDTITETRMVQQLQLWDTRCYNRNTAIEYNNKASRQLLSKTGKKTLESNNAANSSTTKYWYLYRNHWCFSKTRNLSIWETKQKTSKNTDPTDLKAPKRLQEDAWLRSQSEMRQAKAEAQPDAGRIHWPKDRR